MPEFFRALGDLADAVGFMSSEISLAQRDSVAKAIRERGYRSIDEYDLDPDFIVAKKAASQQLQTEMYGTTFMSQSVASNVLAGIESHHRIPYGIARLAYEHSAALLEREDRPHEPPATTAASAVIERVNA